MLKQLVKVSDNTVVVQEVDVSTSPQLPVFGGDWGNSQLFVWIDAPDARVIELKAENKITLIKQEHEASLASHFTTTLGITMQATFESIQMLKAGYDLAVLLSQTTMDITDANNVEHVATPIADVNTILIELGTNYATLRAAKNTRRTVVVATVASTKSLKNKLSAIAAA